MPRLNETTYKAPKKVVTKAPIYSMTDPNAMFRAKNRADAIAKGLIKSSYTEPGSKPTAKKPTTKTTVKGGTVYKKAASAVKKAGSAVASAAAGKGSTSKPLTAAQKKAAADKAARGAAATAKAASDSLSKAAKDSVAAELDPKIKAITQAQQAYDKQASDAQDTTKKRGEQVKHDIGYLYSNLDTKLKAQQGETATAYSNAASQVDQNYNQLIQRLQSNTGAATDKVNAEAARLGLTPPVESRAGADGNFATQLADINRTNASLMIAAQGRNNASTGSFITQAEQGLGVQKTADFSTANENALTQMLKDQQAQDTKYSNEKLSLEEQRSTMEQQYLKQLEQQQYDRAQEASQQAFMNSLAVGKFNLSQDKFLADQNYRDAQLKLETAKIQAAAQKAAGTSAKTYNISAATKSITDIPDKQLGSSMLQAWNAARTSGAYDFNDPKSRAAVIAAFRAALSNNGINTGENMDKIINAYDIYMGSNYA